MPGANVQFAVATHIAAVLSLYSEGMTSAQIAMSVNTETTFVRKSVSKLAKAGIVKASRGKNGTCLLAKPPEEITLKDIYIASGPVGLPLVHDYPIQPLCIVSRNIKGALSHVQSEVEFNIRETLAKVSLKQFAQSIKRCDRRTNRLIS